MDSAFVADHDKKWAITLAKKMGAELDVIKWDPLSDIKIKQNSSQRCYYCKHRMYTLLVERTKIKNIDNILDGTNMDDLKKNRPGLKALKELNINTPFVGAAVNKRHIRRLAQDMPLDVNKRLSQSCLATRVKHGQVIEISLLRLIENAEKILRNEGMSHVRCRIDKNSAQVNAVSGSISKDQKKIITEKLEKLGFDSVDLILKTFAI